MEKIKRRYGMILAGAAVIAATGAISFVFASSARAGETAGTVRQKTAPLREMPDSIRERFSDLKKELETPGLKSVRVREIIDSMTTTAMAWHQMAPEVFETILPLHKDQRWEVRRDAAFALGFIGEKIDDLGESAMETLMKMIRDSAPKVRQAVAERIGALGRSNRLVGIDARVALDVLRQDPDEKVRQVAEKHYSDLVRRYPVPRAG